MKCGHCDEPFRKGDAVGACPMHGSPGKALPRGVPRCTVCVRCLKRMTDDAPMEPIVDTRRAIPTDGGGR